MKLWYLFFKKKTTASVYVDEEKSKLESEDESWGTDEIHYFYDK